MVSFIMAPPDLRDHDFYIFDFALCQEVFIQILAFLAQWFLRRFSNDPTLLLHFYDHFPFKQNWALYLNSFAFPSPKDG
jgi:hypothetical protein